MESRIPDETMPRKLADTRIFLAGKKLNLGERAVIDWLKANKITHVFCLFPLKQKHFDGLPEDAKRGTQSIMEFFAVMEIDPSFPARLRGHGIGASTLLRHPKYRREFRAYDSFLNEAKTVKQNFLIVCKGGWFASGSYAMYYLAANTPLTMAQIREKFVKSGYAKDNLTLLNSFFKRANIDIEKVVEEKLARRKEIATALKAVHDAKWKKHKRKTRGSHKKGKGKKPRA